MQAEMERGGKLFFDLFVAMCNHMVSLVCSGWGVVRFADFYRMIMFLVSRSVVLFLLLAVRFDIRMDWVW